MAPELQAVVDAALSLPEMDRVQLVERLMDTLPPEPDELDEDQLRAELRRRRDEVHAGTAQGIPWSELRKEC
jgi:putative addiction module component (TIGR02574 family)